MDRAQWPQEKPMVERVVVVTNTSDAATCSNSKPCITSESCKKVKPHKDVEQIINCPRCNSSNTKFCYYNNYSLSQPRYFCKTCRRYWTEGGSLRNIPVGGGSRKNNKRSSNSSPSSSVSQSNSSASSKKFPSADHHQPLAPPPQVPNNMNLYDNHQDLNLSNDFKTFSQLIQVPDFENIGNRVGSTYSTSSPTNSFMPMLPNIPSSTTFLGFPLNTADQYHQFMKPVSGHSFSLDNDLGIDNNTTSGSTGRHLFPFEDLKLQASHDNPTDHPGTTNGDNSDDHHNNGRDNEGDEPSNGFWNGMLGTGPW